MTYTSRSIRVLKGLEACRTRPGMYIGNTQDGSGLHHMIYEVLDNSIDEHLAGHCTTIKVTLDGQWVTVRDNGRGIPVDIHEDEGISAAILIMTQLHAGGKFDNDSYEVSGGLHGVGVSVVNALSERLEMTICRDGKKYHAAFERGDVVEDLKEIGESNERGTEVKFFADAQIFTEIKYEASLIEARLSQLSYLNPGLKIEFEDVAAGTCREFYEPKGITAFVESLLKNKSALHETIEFSHTQDKMKIRCALVWSDSYSEDIRCFTNTIPQHDGGTHLVGLKVALTRCVNNYLQKNQHLFKKLKDLQLTGEDIREGVVCVLAVYMPEPQFASQTKEKLVSSSIRPIIEAGVGTALEAWLEENPNDAKRIIQKIIDAAFAREAARKSRDLVRNNKSTEFSLSMATKLAGCTQKDPAKAELFIVEGDSAGGSAKMARNRLFQAVLPLRGKILNVEKAGLSRMLDDEGIRTLIAVIGTGIGDTFDITKIRYNKIVLMTDADVDGSHILTLLITFFFRYMKPIIENGFLYVAQPPLYGVKQGQKMHYLLDDVALAEFLLDRSLGRIKIIKNGEQIDVNLVKDFIKDLFAISHYIKGSGVLHEALLCAKISEITEDCYDKVVEILKTLRQGKWTYEVVEGIAVFTNENNGLIYKYSVMKNQLSKKYIEFVRKWSDFWGDEVQVGFDSDAKKTRAAINPMEIFELFSKKEMSDVQIQRYKGLGEMNADDLAKTAMQSYLQVRYEDELEADELIKNLLGKDVMWRKDFIATMDPIEEDD